MNNGSKMRLFSMVFFGICNVLMLYTVPASACMGSRGLGVWLLFIPLFLLPSCLVISELGSTWCNNGGIYIWAKEAFGNFIGTQVAWMYWANTLFTNPLDCVTLIGVLCSYFLPKATNITQMILVIAVIWFITFLGIVNSTITQRITSYGGNAILVILGLLGITGLIYGFKNGFANRITFDSIMPTSSLILQFGPIVIFNVLGLELLNSIANRMDNPQKNVPKFIITAGLLIVALYILGSVGILAVMPAENVDSVSGLIDSMIIIVADLFGGDFSFISTILVLCIIYAMLANGIGWALGTSFVISTTGLDQKSKILGHYNKKFGTPDYAYIISAAVGTLYVVFNYIGDSSIQSIFWVIFSFSAMTFIAPYLFMFPAVIKLRYKEPDIIRPYKIPGGQAGFWICGILSTLGVIFSLVFFAIPRDPTVNVLTYELKMWGGFAIVASGGVVMYFNNAKKQRKLKTKSLS